MHIEKMCKELKKERDLLRETLLQEKSKNAELLRRLESDANAASEARQEDKKYISKLERELRNCSQKIGYLQEQLNLRTVEADYMSEHVHSLELKLEDVEKLHEKLRLLNKELVQSDSKRLSLMQELKHREKELQNCSIHVEDLETAVASITLESQCEIESMKIDIEALEQRCFEAESFSQRAALDNTRSDELLDEFESKFQEALEQISLLEKENTELKDKLMTSERFAKESSYEVEHLDNWLKFIKRMRAHMYSGSNQDFLVKLREELSLLKEKSIYVEVLDPFLSKLTTLIARDEEAEKRSNQIHESEATIEKLKEDLREEKRKAKEEAEDLIQEMAELRYQMTDMIEEERNRRASIEQASLQRIQELEAQVRKEQSKSYVTLRHLQEGSGVDKMQSIEVRHLKSAIEGLHGSASIEMPREIDSYSCVSCPTSNCLSDCSSERSIDAETSDDVCNVDAPHRARIEWLPDDTGAGAR